MKSANIFLNVKSLLWIYWISAEGQLAKFVITGGKKGVRQFCLYIQSGFNVWDYDGKWFHLTKN